MMIPPMVGVPALAWWPSGPSSRMFWPNSRARRNAMNFGDRNTQISSEAVPAIRTSPTRQRLRDLLQPDTARRLHEHDVPRAHEPGDHVRGLTGIRGGEGLTPEGGRHRRGRQGADGDQHINTRRRGVLAQRPML